PKVADHQGYDGEHGNTDSVRVQPGRGGGDGSDAGRNAHRDRQGVVDQQRGPGDQGRAGAEVVLGHGVGAAAQGVGEVRPAVGEAVDDEQRGDGAADRDDVAIRRGSGEDEEQEDVLGGIGGRGDGVGAENRQRLRLGQALMCLLRRAERRADEQPAELAVETPDRAAGFGRRGHDVARLGRAGAQVGGAYGTDVAVPWVRAANRLLGRYAWLGLLASGIVWVLLARRTCLPRGGGNTEGSR